MIQKRREIQNPTERLQTHCLMTKRDQLCMIACLIFLQVIVLCLFLSYYFHEYQHPQSTLLASPTRDGYSIKGISLPFINNRVSLFYEEFKDNALKNGLFVRCNQTIKEQLSYSSELPTCAQKRISVILGVVFWVKYDGAPGTPVGELIQWTDLIQGLMVIGHNVTVIETVSHYEKLKYSLDDNFDIIFCDYHFTSRVRDNSRIWTGSLRSKLRVVDTFGTQQFFNAMPPEDAERANIISTYCCLQIHPAQYYTFYPHTPENTFLGYAVQSCKYHKHSSSTQISGNTIHYSKKDQVVVWGKQSNYWELARLYLNTISNHFEVHGTAKDFDKRLPSYVKNHDVLTPQDYGALLEDSKLFLGIGFPLDGPSPLEALARGCLFVNPKYIPPISSKEGNWLRGKPTLRKYTSQHPYLEQFTSHVKTIDIKNRTEVMEMIEWAKNVKEFEPFIPEDFQVGNFLRRVFYLVNNQTFEARNGFIAAV